MVESFTGPFGDRRRQLRFCKEKNEKKWNLMVADFAGAFGDRRRQWRFCKEKNEKKWNPMRVKKSKGLSSYVIFFTFFQEKMTFFRFRYLLAPISREFFAISFCSFCAFIFNKLGNILEEVPHFRSHLSIFI